MELKWKEHIDTNPGVMLGKPVIKGTRIPVQLILVKISLGESIEQLLRSYPSITKEDIQSCLLFDKE